MIDTLGLKYFIPIVILFIVIIPTILAYHVIYGFDITPTVDLNNRVLLTGPPNIYKFGTPHMRNVTYSDGSIVPSVTMSIEQYNQTTKQWEIVGATNTHLHKLKIDATDKWDISLGHTDRFNPKVIPPIAPPSTVD